VKSLPAASAAACPVCGELTTQIYFDQEKSVLELLAIGSSRRHTAPGRILRYGLLRIRIPGDASLAGTTQRNVPANGP
jgi:hypothetical protein